MIISYSKMFIFYHLEKTGGTTIERSLAPSLELGDLFIRDYLKFFYSPKAALAEHSTSRSAREFLGDDCYKFRHFATVRNPLDLMSSMYHYGNLLWQTMTYDTGPPEGAAKEALRAASRGAGFSGFVDGMLDKDHNMTIPQQERLKFIMDADFMLVDTVNITSQWAQIKDFLGVDQSLPLENHNVLGRGRIAMDAITENKIRNHFETDYRALPALTGKEWD